MENSAERRKHRKNILRETRQSDDSQNNYVPNSKNVYQSTFHLCLCFINANTNITTVIAEKQKRTSPCDTQFKGHSPIVDTQCTPLSNIMLSTNQCECNHTSESAIRARHSFYQRTIDASIIQTNLMLKFGKENLIPLMLNHHANCSIHTISDADLIHSLSTTQHIHSGRYTIHKSILIKHISYDIDEEINKTNGGINTSQMLLLCLIKETLLEGCCCV